MAIDTAVYNETGSYHCRETPGIRKALGMKRQFERTRHFEEFNIGLVTDLGEEAVACLIDDVSMPA